MSITYLDAEDELFGMVNAAFVAAIEGISPVPTLFFPGELQGLPPTDQTYATVSFIVPVEAQSGMGNPGGVSLYETKGLLAVQFYSPKQLVSALRTIKQIADAVRDAFRKPSPSGEIWFTDQRCTPVAGNLSMNQVNVVVTCTYKTEK